MSTTTAQVLMRKGKRGAAGYIHADCSSGSPQLLGGLLDVLLHPNKAIDEWETIDWCRWLIAGGRTPDEFAAIVRGYDNHVKCGLVWIPHVVAYRCRTCGISPCMSICRECFRRGDHSTHDFNMFLSQAGGACDCGDTSVMKEDGFCSNHGINNCATKSPAPADLMCVAEAMMPRVILRLLQHFRENSGESQSNTYRKAVQECEGYVAMLMEFNNMGELMRKAMTKALINPQMYRNMVEPPFPETEYGMYMGKSRLIYEKAIEDFPAPEPPSEYKHFPALGKKMNHTTLLEEFIFWTFKYEFPQNVVCFLLNMLPDQDYKEHLTRTFVMHYARIPLVLELSADPDMLSNRVVHMSVQLFSNEALALRMVNQLNLLHVMVISLKVMMTKILVKNTLHDQCKNCHRVIDCARRVMKEHCYWPLVSDFNNVLSHKSVALVFLQEETLIDMWFEFLSMLQGMNVNVRELGSHVEFEPSSYYAAFSCELEASAYPMWSVISHLTDSTHADLAKKLIRYCLAYLTRWLDAISFSRPHIDGTEVMRASFHFPLHRYLAAFICQAVRHMEVPIAELVPQTDLLLLLMMHPLRVQSLFYEILSGIWVRNGLQIKGQAMTYIQANFCNSMVDMDIYFLQVCASHLPKGQFLDICINTFGVGEWLSMCSLSPAQEQEQDTMLEGLLTFLAMIVSSRTNMGNDELTQSRLEISTLLATGDKTHSQLLELMPERSGNAHTRNFETVLKELSYYRSPPRGSETLEQGQFAPRAAVWAAHYDPLHVLQRAVHRRDFQNSMDRFTAYVQSSGLAPSNCNTAPGGTVLGASSAAGAEATPSTTAGTTTGSTAGTTAGTTSSTANANTGRAPALWPPLRPAKAPPAGSGCDPRQVVRCGRLHAALLAVLHRAAHRKRPPPENVLALAVFLLEVAADAEKEAGENGELPFEEQSQVCQWNWNASSRGLLDSFSGDRLGENCRMSISNVTTPFSLPLPLEKFSTTYNSDSDSEWDTSETESNENVERRVALGGGSAVTAGPLLPARRQLPHDIDEDDNLVDGARAVLMQDYVMRDDDEISLQEESYQLALPPAESVIGDNTQMTVAVQGDMSVVPAAHDVTEMFSSEGGSGTVSGVSGGVSSVVGGSSLYLHYARVQPAPPPQPISVSVPTPPVLKRTSSKSNRTINAANSESRVVPINESIISLLLKLHSQLSGCLDSFSLEDESSESMGSEGVADMTTGDDEKVPSTDTSSDTQSQSNISDRHSQTSTAEGDRNTCESRIGDGPHFIGNLLRKLCALDSRCALGVSGVRAALWPRQRERQAEQRAREQREREERTRKARERQRILMQDFAHRQNVFMKRAMESEECGGMEWQDEEEVVLEKEYDCIICNTTSPSTETNPIGLVVLLQSTSVVGHRRKASDRTALALSDAERKKQLPPRDNTLAADHFRRHHEMDQLFDSESWLVSVNVGWEGGVHVQSCGHHVHLACLQAYLRSLTNPQRPHNLHIDRGEFLCPVCRQLANSVLPLSPQLGRASLARCQPPDTPTLISEIQAFLKDYQRPPTSSNLSEAMGKAMEDMTNSTQLRFKQRGTAPSHQTLFLFVSSVARTNLEAELVQRGGTLTASSPRYKPRRDCIVPLLHVLAVHARVLAQWPASDWWQELTSGGLSGEDNTVAGVQPSELVVAGAPTGTTRLPLMLRDPVALLIHFLLLAPLHLELPYLTCMIRVLYNLTYYQVVAQLLPGMTTRQRECLRVRGANESHLVRVATMLLTTLDGSQLLEDEDNFDEASTSSAPDTVGNVDLSSMEGQVQQLCLPFLRIASLLRHHLYGEELPTVSNPQDEFTRLVFYLELVNDDVRSMPLEAGSALHWGFADGKWSEAAIGARWALALSSTASRCPSPTRRLLMQHHPWAQPALLRLPREYDRLFTYYHERICSQCGAVPKEASVCLLCGTVVCLKQQCCRQQDVCEAVQHSIDCGGGTGIFLVVTSTYIIIVRGRRACLWGSLYLDDYDEEDRDLKRGKPLYLSEDRFELLEQQWLAHRFDHTKRTWVWHRDSL